ncbi:BofC C-terminal domain-containing protein [Metabacillus sp. 84]|uniref:BofC C-terminal domain-containing protein n=1 Tax=unclassified Metabacillus TaxID=2675274 RepID=UPI003CEE8E26
MAKWMIYVSMMLLTLFLSVPPESAFAQADRLKVDFERTYLDGEVSIETKEETVRNIKSLMARDSGWTVERHSGQSILLRKKINDISPLMKANGYFGLDNEGILTIYDGKPDEAVKVIQSFYQIDVGKLETRRHCELENGIRVESRNRYLKVIETFRNYGTPPAKK